MSPHHHIYIIYALPTMLSMYIFMQTLIRTFLPSRRVLKKFLWVITCILVIGFFILFPFVFRTLAFIFLLRVFAIPVKLILRAVVFVGNWITGVLERILRYVIFIEIFIAGFVFFPTPFKFVVKFVANMLWIISKLYLMASFIEFIFRVSIFVGNCITGGFERILRSIIFMETRGEGLFVRAKDVVDDSLEDVAGISLNL
ncbi:hypothetical protein F4806DRAFT_108334 [Annulohypoxylon nitens]|nr:hypothetical protein F4806DRAFT_108334 [Annulohypoxylon nitens]